jgi:hypothetical protein
MSDARVFIGSPSEDAGLGSALQGRLESCASVRVWNQGVFEANRGSLESLLSAVDEYDFACFLAPPVDKVESRESAHYATRDNIIFEYGLFLGRLGPDRVFLIHPRGTSLSLPSDLKGVTHLTYKPVDEENPPPAVLGPTAQVIEERIKSHGKRQREVHRRYSPVLERGTVDRVASVSDAAVYYARRRYGYKDDIRQLVLGGKVIPSLYYYATEDGAEFWIEMSSNPHYRFKSNSSRLIRKVAKNVAETIRASAAGDGSVDLISLGSGDGQKDRVLLTELIEAEIPSITYYPLDISDALIVECIRNVHGSAFDYAGMKTKAIIGNFIDLQVLRSVYEDRPSPNIFSVLGNTFGNTDEAQILEALQNSMYPGDFALIEINCDVEEVGSTRSFLANEATLRYSCIPLEMIGQEIDLKNVTVREEDLSVFPCARSSATLYGEIALEGKVITEVPLAYDHRYPLDEFNRELADNLEVEILLAEQYGNAAVVLAKKTA